MSTFKLEIKGEQIEKAQELLSSFGKEAERSVKHAISRSIRGVITDSSREIPKEYNIRPMMIRKSFRIQKSGLSATAVSRGQNQSLMKFKPTPKKRTRIAPPGGITVEIRKGVKTVKPDSFIGTARKSGSQQIFTRIGKERLPVKKETGLSIPVMLEKADLVETIQERSQERFEKNLEHNINRLLTRKGFK